MNEEEQRLRSFTSAPHAWPHAGSLLSPANLAKIGFFFCPTPQAPDRCVCFACKQALTHWGHDDDPQAEHKQWYPQCPLSLGQSAGNIPLNSPEDSQELDSEKDGNRSIPVTAADGSDNSPNHGESTSQGSGGNVGTDHVFKRANSFVHQAKDKLSLNSYVQSLQRTLSATTLSGNTANSRAENSNPITEELFLVSEEKQPVGTEASPSKGHVKASPSSNGAVTTQLTSSVASKALSSQNGFISQNKDSGEIDEKATFGTLALSSPANAGGATGLETMPSLVENGSSTTSSTSPRGAWNGAASVPAAAESDGVIVVSRRKKDKKKKRASSKTNTVNASTEKEKLKQASTSTSDAQQLNGSASLLAADSKKTVAGVQMDVSLVSLRQELSELRGNVLTSFQCIADSFNDGSQSNLKEGVEEFQVRLSKLPVMGDRLRHACNNIRQAKLATENMIAAAADARLRKVEAEQELTIVVNKLEGKQADLERVNEAEARLEKLSGEEAEVKQSIAELSRAADAKQEELLKVCNSHASALTEMSEVSERLAVAQEKLQSLERRERELDERENMLNGRESDLNVFERQILEREKDVKDGEQWVDEKKDYLNVMEGALNNWNLKLAQKERTLSLSAENHATSSPGGANAQQSPGSIFSSMLGEGEGSIFGMLGGGSSAEKVKDAEVEVDLDH